MLKTIIVDTDVFGDPDDLLAISYILMRPEKVKVELFVTCDEHKQMRAAWLKKILTESGWDTNVVAGEDLGNSRLFLFENIATEDVATDYLEKIKQVVSANDNIIYLCMGPQTNLANFLRKYPELAHKIDVMAMAGVLDIDLGRTEHNVRYDIDAFKHVCGLTEPKLLLADHTWHDSMKFSTQHRIYKLLEAKKNPMAQAIIKNANLFFKKLYPESRFHDPVLVSALMGEFVEFCSEKISIDSEGKMTRTESGGKIGVSCKVDYLGMLDDFATSLNRLPHL